MRLESENPETEKRIALALGITLGTVAEATSNDLSQLYKRLHLGGGIFNGKAMTVELAKATRYEIFPYLAALSAVLVQNWPQKTTSADSILGHLEKMMFTLDLEKSKPTYAYYLDRYYHPRHSDSASLPKETIIHSEFCHRLAKIWGLYQRSTDSKTANYASSVGQLSQNIESAFRSELAEIWPENT